MESTNTLWSHLPPSNMVDLEVDYLMSLSNIEAISQLIKNAPNAAYAWNLKKAIYQWILTYGEQRHIGLLYERRLYSIQEDSYRLLYLTSAEPTDRCKQLFRLYLYQSHASVTSYIMGIILGSDRENCLEYAIEWIYFTFVRCVTFRRSEIDFLLFAFTGGYRILNLLDRLFRDNEISAYYYAITVELHGVIRMLLYNDVSEHLRLSARRNDICKPIGIEPQWPYDKAKYEDHIFYALSIFCSSQDLLRYVQTSNAFEFSCFLLNIFKVSAESLKRLGTYSRRPNFFITKLGHWLRKCLDLRSKRLEAFGVRLVRDEIKHALANRYSLKDTICILNTLQALNAKVRLVFSDDDIGHLISRISLAELADASISCKDLATLLFATFDHKRGLVEAFSESIDDDFIRILLYKGVCVHSLHCQDDLDGFLHNTMFFQTTKWSNQVLDSTCWCLHYLGCCDNVLPLRCLAAASVKKSQYEAVVKPQIYIGKGCVKVSVSHFCHAHGSLTSDFRQALYTHDDELSDFGDESE